MTKWLVVLVVGLVGCAGDGDDKGSETDTDTTDTDPTGGEIDVTGLWTGSCGPLATESGTATITEVTLDLIDTDGAITGVWDSVADIHTTTTTTDTTTESYPVTGTRTDDQLSIDLDTGTSGYPVTLEGTVDGDSMTLTLAIEGSTSTPSSSCTLTR